MATDSDTVRVRVPVQSPTRDRLRAAKVGGESYDDVVNRLLDQYEPPRAAAGGQ